MYSWLNKKWPNQHNIGSIQFMTVFVSFPLSFYSRSINSWLNIHQTLPHTGDITSWGQAGQVSFTFFGAFLLDFSCCENVLPFTVFWTFAFFLTYQNKVALVWYALHIGPKFVLPKKKRIRQFVTQIWNS